MAQTLDQKRAAAAWKAVEEVCDEESGKKYTAWVRKTPSLILTNGLGQTLAFLRAKGKGDNASEYQRVYNHLSEWVLPHLDPNIPNNPTERRKLLEWLLRQDSHVYRQATAEALAYINWLKRFAEARFGEVRDTEE